MVDNITNNNTYNSMSNRNYNDISQWKSRSWIGSGKKNVAGLNRFIESPVAK